MELRLYDTLTREKRPFKPLDRANVRMYVCGPTVYDFAHIGNARPVIVFDVLFRLLRHLYGPEHVTYVRNITDVDDKINARAAESYPGVPLNEAIRKVTSETEKQFHADVAALGCLEPTAEPRATEHIDDMKVLIEKLIKNRRAYVLDNHVLFRVKGLRSYGKLSHRSLSDMKTSARGEVAPKHNSMDFVLWKPSKRDEPAWPSPAGIETPGRPGWHVECSAMADKLLWENVLPKLSKKGRAHPHRFDIHGGGIDLLFPHHENERAQSCRAFSRLKMAQYWLHNAFLQVEGEKMSKSLGNFLTINDQIDEWGGAVLRFNMLRTHYRRTIDWTRASLKESGRELSRWIDLVQSDPGADDAGRQTVVEALCDDLNTNGAITQMRAFARVGNAPALRSAMSFLGISDVPGSAEGRKNRRLYAEPGVRRVRGSAAVLRVTRPDGSVEIDAESRARIEELLVARTEARAAKNFIEADRIRDELAAMGVVLHDTKDGTTWEIAR